jgi:hypothetical protein
LSQYSHQIYRTIYIYLDSLKIDIAK